MLPQQTTSGSEQDGVQTFLVLMHPHLRLAGDLSSVSGAMSVMSLWAFERLGGNRETLLNRQCISSEYQENKRGPCFHSLGS